MNNKLEEDYLSSLNELKKIVNNIYLQLISEEFSLDHIVIKTKMDINLISNIFVSLYPEVEVKSTCTNYREIWFKDFYITIQNFDNTTVFTKYKYKEYTMNEEEDLITNDNEEISNSIENDIIALKGSIRSIINRLINYLVNNKNELIINSVLDLRSFQPELWRIFKYGEIQYPEAGRYLWANTDDNWQFIVFEKLIISIQIDSEKKTTTISRLIHGLKDTLIWAACYKDR